MDQFPNNGDQLTQALAIQDLKFMTLRWMHSSTRAINSEEHAIYFYNLYVYSLD